MAEEFYGTEWEEKMFQRLAPRIEQSVKAMFAGRGATFGQEKAFLEEKIDKLRREIALEAEGKRATLSEAERGREFSAEEAQKGREFQASEAEKARSYRTQEIENARNRAFYGLDAYSGEQGQQTIKTLIGEFTEEQLRKDPTIIDDLTKVSPAQANFLIKRFGLRQTPDAVLKEEGGEKSKEEKEQLQVQETPTTPTIPVPEGQTRWYKEKSGLVGGGQTKVGFSGSEEAEAKRRDERSVFQSENVRPTFNSYPTNLEGFSRWFNDEKNWILRNTPNITALQAIEAIIQNPETYKNFSKAGGIKDSTAELGKLPLKDYKDFAKGQGYDFGNFNYEKTDRETTTTTTSTEGQVRGKTEKEIAEEEKVKKESEEKGWGKNLPKDTIVTDKLPKKQQPLPPDETVYAVPKLSAVPGFKSFPTATAPVGQEIVTEARTPFKFPKETTNYGYGDEVIKENVPQTNLPQQPNLVQSQGLFQTPETYLDRFKKRTNPRVNPGRGFFQYGGYKGSV